jgi:hypothetical protein
MRGERENRGGWCVLTHCAVVALRAKEAVHEEDGRVGLGRLCGRIMASIRELDGLEAPHRRRQCSWT